VSNFAQTLRYGCAICASTGVLLTLPGLECRRPRLFKRAAFLP
jgi:hypothetical protein